MNTHSTASRRFRIAAALVVAGAAALPSGCQTHATRPAAPPPAIPEMISSDRSRGDVLGGDEIRLLVWNVHKGESDQWIGDFRTLAAGSDLVLLQEAHLHDEFAAGLAGMPRWDMVQAWRMRNAPTGVLTASAVDPISERALESREPILRTDKSALLTEYRLAGSSQSLLVANVHAINFTVGTGAYRAQLDAVAALLAAHDGPVIFSGDLNTWRDARGQVVRDLAAQLGLQEVAFTGPRKQFRQYPLDHVYYRGLQLASAEVSAVESSDHNPLFVTFRRPVELPR